MIRKDTLPDVWGDSWNTQTPPQQMQIPSGQQQQLVLCNPADAPMFMLHEEEGYRILPDIENLHIDVEAGAGLTLYRLQGMNCGINPDGNPAQHLTHLSLSLHGDNAVQLCTVTLGGSHVRNNILVRMNGEHCELQADGLPILIRQPGT